jgi:hypothetical protein
MEYISDEKYEGKQIPKYEDIASEKGIALVYQYYCYKETGVKMELSEIKFEDVLLKARNGDKIAYQTMLAHYQFLIRAAKAVSTSFGCDSVILASDNQVKNDWFVQRVKNELHAEFHQFTRPDLMKNIRVYTQAEFQNFNLLGTGLLASSLLK